MPLGEKLFRYLHQNFGLDSLPDHRLEALDPQVRVVKPQWRAMVNLAQRLKAKLGRLQPKEADEL